MTVGELSEKLIALAKQEELVEAQRRDPRLNPDVLERSQQVLAILHNEPVCESLSED